MALQGSLEDLSLVDVLQLMYVTRKTGVLQINSEHGSGCLALREGFLVGARHPCGDRTTGQNLVASGLVSKEQVAEALERQQTAGLSRKPLIATLVEMGHLDSQQCWQPLEKLVQDTMVELVSWERGQFAFEPGSHVADDLFRHVPAEVAADVNVDVQEALLAALRVVDARSGADGGTEPAEAALPPAAGTNRPVAALRAAARDRRATASDAITTRPEESRTGGSNGRGQPGTSRGNGRERKRLPAHAFATGLPLAPSGRPDPKPSARPERRAPRRVALLSTDALLRLSLGPACTAADIEVLPVEVEQDLHWALADWVAEGIIPAVVIDLAGDDNRAPTRTRRLDLLRRLREAEPEIPLLLLTDGGANSYGDVLALGVTSMLPRPKAATTGGAYVDEMKQLITAIMSCLDGLFDHLSRAAARMRKERLELQVLCHRAREIRRSGSSSEISLAVLRSAADFLERCVIFLVRGGDLLALGAFGLSSAGDALTPELATLKIPVRQGSLLHEVIELGAIFQGRADEELFNEHLYKHIGRPLEPDILLLPLRTERRTAALIYGDLGTCRGATTRIDALEILADIAGMAFELASSKRSRRSVLRRGESLLERTQRASGERPALGVEFTENPSLGAELTSGTSGDGG